MITCWLSPLGLGFSFLKSANQLPLIFSAFQFPECCYSHCFHSLSFAEKIKTNLTTILQFFKLSSMSNMTLELTTPRSSHEFYWVSQPGTPHFSIVLKEFSGWCGIKYVHLTQFLYHNNTQLNEKKKLLNNTYGPIFVKKKKKVCIF